MICVSWTFVSCSIPVYEGLNILAEWLFMVLSVCGYQAYHDVSCATGRTQQQGGTADRASQTDEGVVSEEEFKGAEEWFREWRKRRSGSDTTSATATTGESTNLSLIHI